MCVALIRSLMLYLLVIFAVRLMGKRQLGELQPSELVVTILVSNIATLPIENTGVPMIVGVAPILSLVCFEVLMSRLILRYPKLRKLVSGSPKIIVREGKLDAEVMNELRFSVDDLMTALRGRDVFDIGEVQYAIVETTGSMSVMKKPREDVPTRSDLRVKAEDEDPPQLVAAEGRILPAAADSVGLSAEAIKRILAGAGKSVGEVLLMTANKNGDCLIYGAEGGAPLKAKGAAK